jgi:uncharacterized protein
MALEAGLSRWPPPQVARLSGDRLHLQHGPIDLVIKAEGLDGDVAASAAAAAGRFQTLLGELVEELPLLRLPLDGTHAPRAHGAVARRMIAACWPHRDPFITPMAAVAGSVADEIRDHMLAAAPGLRTLFVNNGGDISVHVGTGAALHIGLVADLAAARPQGVMTLDSTSAIGGIATSGWRGRSFSLGIADAATVLARTAAEADAAATVIGNSVATEDAAIRRRPACDLDPDSDLGDRLVTVEVGLLPAPARTIAIRGGLEAARRLHQSGCIAAALIALQGEIAVWPP